MEISNCGNFQKLHEAVVIAGLELIANIARSYRKSYIENRNNNVKSGEH